MRSFADPSEGRRRFSERLFGQTAKQMIKREERMNAGR